MKFLVYLPKIKTAVKGLYTHSIVELIVCCVFAVLTLLFKEEYSIDRLIAYFPMFVALGITCNNIFSNNRVLYIVTSVCGMLLLAYLVTLGDPFTIGHLMGLILATLLVFITQATCHDNTSTSSSIVTTIADVIKSLFVGFVTFAMIGAIVGSVVYLFDLDANLMEYTWQWSTFLFAPMTFCALCRNHRGNPIVTDKSAFLRALSRYVVTPAIIIYTAILYTYALKVAITITLPQGGVAWLIIAFYATSMLGYMGHLWAPLKHFNWFYKWFAFISIPLLVLFWWGVCYRIGAYSFTENRVYLVVVGSVITIASVMLALRYKNSLKVCAWIACIALAVFTYIPGINAHSLGVTAQTQRLERYMAELDVLGSDGRFKAYDPIKVKGKDYEIEQLKASYDYLRDETDAMTTKEKYKPLDDTSQDIMQHQSTKKAKRNDGMSQNLAICDGTAIDSSQYPYYYGEANTHHAANMRIEPDNDHIILSHNGELILNEPIKKREIRRLLTSTNSFQVETDSLDVFTYTNDSVMLVVNSYHMDDSGNYRAYTGTVFAKKTFGKSKNK